MVNPPLVEFHRAVTGVADHVGFGHGERESGRSEESDCGGLNSDLWLVGYGIPLRRPVRSSRLLAATPRKAGNA
ncbi:hypothetical protein D9M69_549680 [compost metagenome]